MPQPSNLYVIFTCLFTNDYDETIRDVDDSIDMFRQWFCDDTGIRCARLLKPQMPADVIKVTEKGSKLFMSFSINSTHVISVHGPLNIIKKWCNGLSIYFAAEALPVYIG